MTAANPLSILTDDWLPSHDFAVLRQGFLDHGRDYSIVIQDCLGPTPGTHQLTFTHVVVAHIDTALSADGWMTSWDDVFLDWEKSKDLSGYIWGTNWSNAYPGLEALEDDAAAAEWTKRLDRPMHAVRLTTDRFALRLVFHDVRADRLSDDVSVIEQITNAV